MWKSRKFSGVFVNSAVALGGIDFLFVDFWKQREEFVCDFIAFAAELDELAVDGVRVCCGCDCSGSCDVLICWSFRVVDHFSSGY